MGLSLNCNRFSEKEGMQLLHKHHHCIALAVLVILITLIITADSSSSKEHVNLSHSQYPSKCVVPENP